MRVMLGSMVDFEKERREYARIPISVRVRIEYTGQEFTADSLNLSAGGMFLECSQRLPVGTRVRLKFSAPLIAKYPFRAEAEVVWVGRGEPQGLAVRFTEMSEDDRALLGELAEDADDLHKGDWNDKG